MVDIVNTIGSVAFPFLQNPVIIYCCILLVLGADCFYAFNAVHDPLNSPQLPILENDQYFVLWGMNIDGEPNCSRTDGTWFPTNLIFPPRKATLDEINLYCKGFFADQPCGANLTCTDEEENNNLGITGQVITSAINGVGIVFNNSYLAELKIFSWEIFILMVMLPLIVFVLTASVQAH